MGNDKLSPIFIVVGIPGMFLTQSPYFLMAALVAIASGAIFAVRFIKREASAEYDVIFATMGLIYSVCLLLEGQRLIPLLFFAQVLLAVMAGWFAIETFRLRILLSEKARQVGGARPTARRQGFTRTYQPDSYGAGRTVSTRAGGSRIRDTSSYGRSIAGRSEDPGPGSSRRSRPQLTSDTRVRPRRRPEADEYYDEPEPRSRQGSDYDEPAPPPPENRRPRRPAAGYPEDEPQDRGTSTATRRRPPRLPEEEGYVDEVPPRPPRRVVEVESVEVEEVDPDEYEDDLL
ncbi:Ycf66 family protein [Synechococcus sp. Nb3U1]|uniref:Ycf66 family protein n=1 Tax=Synechococcus sp. Nb3U1 TaxID=1914529 RepID=UPI001F31E691|nr:Ycf66 family protein [Synechococcus sp. Nb3U1]MCF2970638.1 Ycf66 family protein [Synechococcus sp. Nb3U1]